MLMPSGCGAEEQTSPCKIQHPMNLTGRTIQELGSGTHSVTDSDGKPLCCHEWAKTSLVARDPASPHAWSPAMGEKHCLIAGLCLWGCISVSAVFLSHFMCQGRMRTKQILAAKDMPWVLFAQEPGVCGRAKATRSELCKGTEADISQRSPKV